MHAFLRVLVVWTAAGVVACSVPAVRFEEMPVAIGGTTTGLAGSGLMLTSNAGDLEITANGAFVFTEKVARGASYTVMVKHHPARPTQMCTVGNGSGVTGAEDVTSVEVSCRTDAFRVGGVVEGLAGEGLMLEVGGEQMAVNGDGAFTFPTPLLSGSSYEVRVVAQPRLLTQVCAVTRGAGLLEAEDVADVVVRCETSRFTVGGTITGLRGSGLSLQNNAGETIPVTANGQFSFSTAVLSGGSYDVRVLGQPALPTQQCEVRNGDGPVLGEDISTVKIVCETRRFPIGGTVTGLAGTGLVMRNSTGEELSVDANGPFEFKTPMESGEEFEVTTKGQPVRPSQSCTVSGGMGKVGGAPVTSVTINCSIRGFTISGTISGLNGTVVLENNDSDPVSVTSNGEFAFPATVLSGGSYRVEVRTDPDFPAQTCTVASGTGEGDVTDENITSVVVSCTTNEYFVGGSVSGLAPNQSVVVRLAGADLELSANALYQFPSRVLSGESYAVTVVTDPQAPISQHCHVNNGSGQVRNLDITDVEVVCEPNQFTIGGSVDGLVRTGLVLQNNGRDDLVIVRNGAFTFSTSVPSGEPYAVTIRMQPTGQTCVLANGSDTVAAGDITSVVITCGAVHYDPQVVAFEFPAIGGSRVPLAEDDETKPISAPFPIRFGGAAPGFTTLHVSTNGLVSFVVPFLAWSNVALPAVGPVDGMTPHDLVAAFWDDLILNSGSLVHYEVLEQAPNRQLVIEYRNVLHFQPSRPDATITFQIVFFEDSPNIRFNYADVEFDDGSNNLGGSATIGVQVSPDVAGQFSFNRQSLTNGMSLLWTMGTPLAAARGADRSSAAR